MKEFNSGAKKDTKGKLPYHLITKEMMDSIASGLQCGLRKGYGARNWEKGLPLMECHIAALERHIYQWKAGHNLNIETDKDGHAFETLHVDNIMAHAAMLATQVRRDRYDLDDRPSSLDDEDEMEDLWLQSIKDEQQVREESERDEWEYDDDDAELLNQEIVEDMYNMPLEMLPADKLYYLASPYSHPDKETQDHRYLEVSRVAARLIKEYHLKLILPITTSHALRAVDPGLGTSWTAWEALDIELVKRSDVLLVVNMPGVSESIGVQAEINVAQNHGIPVLVIDPVTFAVWRY